MSEAYNIALIGCGTVGTGVARLLLEQPERLAARAGRPLVLRRVVVKHPDKPRDVPLPRDRITDSLKAVLDDPRIDAAVEVVGGVDWPRRAILDLLAAGKDVVTANKALLAQHGPEIFDAGRRHGRAIAFEASVAGGIPIIAALCQSLAANQIQYVQAILNGTSNFILTTMSEHGGGYPEAVAEAQRRGFAEADPTLDVDGTDAAHKLAILVQIAFGVGVPVSAIQRRGIAGIQPADIRFARELGYTIKLLAEAWLNPGVGGQESAAGNQGAGVRNQGSGKPRAAFLAADPSPAVSGSQLALHVSPVMLRHVNPLAQVRDAFNAIYVVGDAVGPALYYGRGAGQMPTASAVAADLIDMAVGRAQRTFQSLRLWSGNQAAITLQPASTVRTRFYLRLSVLDRPGVLAQVDKVLAEQRISIASMIQHEALEEHADDTVPLVIMTHSAATAAFVAAVAGIDRLPCITAPSVYFPVED